VKLFIALAVLVGCTPPPPLATAADAERAHVALDDLGRGRDLLIAKCGGCHDVPLPKDEPRAKWPAQVIDMGQRAGLAPEDEHLLEQYVMAMDGRP
jgi:hypothetical protein